MVVPSKHSVASIPSSLTFRRIASYHSVHSPLPSNGTNAEFGGFNLTAQGIIFTLRSRFNVAFTLKTSRLPLRFDLQNVSLMRKKRLSN
jgi:hypothetical protein